MKYLHSNHPKQGRGSVVKMRGLMRMQYVEIRTPLTVI